MNFSPKERSAARRSSKTRRKGAEGKGQKERGRRKGTGRWRARMMALKVETQINPKDPNR